MKKVLFIIVAAAMCLALSACFGEDAPQKEQAEPTGQTTSEPAKVSEETTFGLNETAVFEDLKFTANELKESEGTTFFNPDSGNVFVGVKFTIENISDEEQSISSLLLFNGYADDIQCDYSISAACIFEGGLDGSIAPGKKIVGWYPLEVPENWSTIELSVKSEWLSNSSATFVFTK